MYNNCRGIRKNSFR